MAAAAATLAAVDNVDRIQVLSSELKMGTICSRLFVGAHLSSGESFNVKQSQGSGLFNVFVRLMRLNSLQREQRKPQVGMGLKSV